MNAIAQPHTIQEQKVLEVFSRHFAAFNAGDLDAVLKDFGEHSVVMTPDGVFEGPEQIRAVYRNLLAEFGVIDIRPGCAACASRDAVHHLARGIEAPRLPVRNRHLHLQGRAVRAPVDRLQHAAAPMRRDPRR